MMLGDNLYNWQFYIQESEAKEEKKEEESVILESSGSYKSTLRCDDSAAKHFILEGLLLCTSFIMNVPGRFRILSKCIVKVFSASDVRLLATAI
jgi:hypothetical protein